jgi:hypothetical protein
MAATRQDYDVDPAMDLADDPDLLIEGEGQNRLRMRNSLPTNGSLKRLNTNSMTKRTRRMTIPSHIEPV